MLDLIAACLLGFDTVLALYLLHLEANDPRHRLQRVEALRPREKDAQELPRSPE